MKKWWIALGIMALLTPIGLILPEVFDAGDAWGEWPAETVGEQTGREPEGMKKDAGLYKAPVPDYHPGSEEDPLFVRSLGYVFSAAVGVGVIVLLTFGLAKLAGPRQKG